MTFWPFQARAWNSPKKIICLVGGTGSGKTWYAPHHIHRDLLKAPERRWLFVGMAYDRHVNRVMTFEFLKYLNLVGEKYEHNKKEGIITLTANESQVLLGSSENPLSLEGPHLEGAWMDEAGLMQRMAYDVVQRRTAHKRGPILITTIPYFEGWLRTDIYEAAILGDPDIEWIPCKTSDNKTYPPEEIERFRRTWRKDKFDRFFNGEWSKAHGVIWPNAVPDSLVDPFDVPEDWPAFSAHDFGFNAPTTGCWGRLSPDDVLYIVADYEANEMSIEEHIRVWRREGLTNVDAAWGDPANPEVWERATQDGYTVEAANNAVNAGIDAVYSRFATGRLKVFRSCKTLADHLATYRWATAPSDDEIVLDKPMKPQPAEHICDALRYLTMGVGSYGLMAPEPFMTSRRRQVG